MCDTIRVELASNADSIINECLNFDFREAVSIAKAKYFYEHIETNPDAIAFFNYHTSPRQQSERLSKDYINNLKTIDVFFPLHFFINRTLDFGTFCVFGVLSEINSYLKRIVPTKVKKAKAIGTFRREDLNVDDEGNQDIKLYQGPMSNGMDEEDNIDQTEVKDGQGEGDAGTVRRLALAETIGLFRVKHANKVYIFKRGGERLRAVGVQNKQIIFEVDTTYQNL